MTRTVVAHTLDKSEGDEGVFSPPTAPWDSHRDTPDKMKHTAAFAFMVTMLKEKQFLINSRSSHQPSSTKQPTNRVIALAGCATTECEQI
jgi:hypothetical protein